MPKRLTKNELEKKIEDFNPDYKLLETFDFSLYKNNRSEIKLKHKCGNIITTSWKNFQEANIACSCDDSHERNMKKYLSMKTKR